jgi:hypothetical protein
MDPIDPAIGAEGRFHLHLAEVAMAAGHPPAPEHLIPGPQRYSVDIFFISLQFHDLAHAFVTENHGETDTRVSSFPLMDIRPADPCRLNPDENFTLL